MVQARGEKQSAEMSGNQYNQSHSDPNDRFKPPASVTDLPAQAPAVVVEDDRTNSSYAIKRTNAGSKTGTSLPAVTLGSSIVEAAHGQTPEDHKIPVENKPTAEPAKETSRTLPEMPDLREDAKPSSSSNASRAEFTTVYDIIDKLENLLDEAKTSVFTPGIAKINREEFIDALADLKKMLPVQLERASALMRESERRLERAQTQAKAITSEAQSQAADLVKAAGEQAEFLAGQENVVAIAQEKAQAIIERSQAQGDKLVHGANEYSAKVMEALSSQLEHYQQDVQAGIQVLHEREREAASQLEQSYVEDH
ncbi:hypothetical protein [Bombiscardovia coagulans]|uniref:Cell division protein n=1 Tax=Bombiscardovia coagulans TaxID=686666 RepID=A0A261EUY2_9BIFI|nr:hypothetical protein [Bombiscardovia coagulans]OZG50663.1 cell division protein [Bombiscardovia coagulans]